jgi:predicted RNase H-like nuclease (RuvC/YqgF family)
MKSNQTSSATTHISQGNNINIVQDLYEMMMMLKQKVNNLEKENSNLHIQLYQLIKTDNSKFLKLNGQIIYLNNIINEQKKELFQQKNQLFQLENYANQQKNYSFKLKSQIKQIQEDNINEKKLAEIKYTKRFNDIEKMILKLEKNYSIMNNEISSYKTNKELLNLISGLLKKIIGDITTLSENKNINTSTIEEIKKKLNKIETKIEEYSKRINDNNLSDIMFVGLNNLIKKIDEIKIQFNYEIKFLEDEIKVLKKKYNEIQRIFISRKVIKIIIKYIIMN